LPNQFAAPSKSDLLPINFTILGGNKAREHVLDSDDVIAVTIQGVFPKDSAEAPPFISSSQVSIAREYYPPNGAVNSPGVGLPVQVQDNGFVHLPLVDPIQARGLTLLELAEKIRLAYVDKEIIKEDNDQVNVTLFRSRVNRILVLREDVASPTIGVAIKGQVIQNKRGSAEVIDLPVYESDVLHALASSGGLPGVDAYNEVWVLRKSTLEPHAVVNIKSKIDGGEEPEQVICQLPAHLEAIRLPLKLCPDQPIPFTPEDVLLQDGDVVYIQPRRDEYFYTGGLLSGGQIPMPRDEDLDVLEAVSLASGSIGGLGGTSSVAVLRAGAGVGNIIPPTRVLILRKLPNGEQLPIRVDLAKAMVDPTERIKIHAGDFIMLYYKPSEITGNAVLNFFNFNVSIRGRN
jgi:protein involved in polysaccharide export with SLBB domain